MDALSERARSVPSGTRFGTARGQATAEFSLVVIVLVGLMLALVDFGHIVAMHAAAVTASREAARYGSTVGIAEVTDAPTPPPANTPRFVFCEGIRHAARKVTSALITLPNDRIDITYDDADDASDPTPANATACADGVNDLADETKIDSFDRISVAVEIRYSPISPLRAFGEVTVISTNRRTIMRASP